MIWFRGTDTTIRCRWHRKVRSQAGLGGCLLGGARVREHDRMRGNRAPYPRPTTRPWPRDAWPEAFDRRRLPASRRTGRAESSDPGGECHPVPRGSVTTLLRCAGPGARIEVLTFNRCARCARASPEEVRRADRCQPAQQDHEYWKGTVGRTTGGNRLRGRRGVPAPARRFAEAAGRQRHSGSGPPGRDPSPPPPRVHPKFPGYPPKGTSGALDPNGQFVRLLACKGTLLTPEGKKGPFLTAGRTHAPPARTASTYRQHTPRVRAPSIRCGRRPRAIGASHS